MLARVAQVAVAAHGIGLRVQSLAFVPGLGVSQAIGAMVGNALGAGDAPEAREVVRGDPSAAVLACPDLECATALQEEFSDHHLRCYAGGDLIGVELAGALKNTVAIAAADVKAIKTHNPFAANDIYLAGKLGIDVNQMNNYGCSLIFGHPQGPTAGRLIIEGIEEVVMALKTRSEFYGLTTGIDTTRIAGSPRRPAAAEWICRCRAGR